MEAKVKEEVPDKEYTQPTIERRKSTASGKERRSPDQEESRSSPTGGPSSPQNNGTALSSTESLSPPPDSRAAPALQRLRRFLSALHTFAVDVGVDTGERVRQLIFNLVAGSISIEEFQCGVQESTNYPLRASVPNFLRALLPLALRDLHARARRGKQTPLQYIRAHEHVVLEAGGDAADIFAHEAGKRRASDPFYESQSNGAHEDYPPAKRPSVFHPSPFYPLPSNASLFDYQPYQPHQEGLERRDGGITVRDVSTMNASLEPRPGLVKTDDEWKNINTMLNCILSMVEKTKRALAILQQRGVEPPESCDMKRAASEIMSAAVRQTEERVAEVRRRAEDAVNQVKRQALVELQRAVGAAETKALQLERHKRHSPPPGRDLSPGAPHSCCWNCGRAAQETCSGCGAARYCGAFCQHRDWENHHQVCSGRDSKPPAAPRASPPAAPAAQPLLPKALPRSSTPIATPLPTPGADRPDTRALTPQERLTSSLTAGLTSNLTSGLTPGAVGGKK